MKFSNGFPIADEGSPVPAEHGRGYELRDFDAHPLYCMGKPKSETELIDPKEFKDRIAHKTEQLNWVRDICDRQGSKVKNQQNSSYCWIHAPVRAMEVHYAVANNRFQQPLSAFKAGADIKDGRNQGGSGIVGAQYLAKYGTCSEALHPPMDFSTRITPEQQANSELHKIVEWGEHDTDDFLGCLHAIISDSLNNICNTVGIPAWSHEILAGTFLVWDPQQFGWCFGGVGIGGDNSWGTTYGNMGRFLLSKNYCRLDECGAILNATPSDS